MSLLGQNPSFTIVLAIFCSLSMVLTARITYLAVFSHEFLNNEGRKRSTRLIETAPIRGTVFDRFNKPLAVSTPLNEHLDIDASLIGHLSVNPQGKSFAYLARRVDPQVASKIVKLSIPGIYERQEYKRFYPQSSMLAQTLGFTNIDQKGIEGIE